MYSTTGFYAYQALTSCRHWARPQALFLETTEKPVEGALERRIDRISAILAKRAGEVFLLVLQYFVRGVVALLTGHAARKRRREYSGANFGAIVVYLVC